MKLRMLWSAIGRLSVERTSARLASASGPVGSTRTSFMAGLARVPTSVIRQGGSAHHTILRTKSHATVVGDARRHMPSLPTATAGHRGPVRCLWALGARVEETQTCE